MASMDTWAALGSVLGGIGGIAGLVALGMEVQDRSEKRRIAAKRKKIAHLPPELRPVLIEVVDALSQVVSSPRDRAWTKEHVEPVRRRFDPLRDVVGTEVDIRLGQSSLTLISVTLNSVEVHAHDEEHPQKPDTAALAAVTQREMAEKGLEAAARILRDLGSVE